MNANKAMELGFADGILTRPSEKENIEQPLVSMMYSKVSVTNSLMDKIAAKCKIQKETDETLIPETKGRAVDSLMERLDLIKQHI